MLELAQRKALIGDRGSWHDTAIELPIRAARVYRQVL